ncbi:ABC transporter permease [Devosia sp. RR2S18]|uniref:ABC transporter permease n=1 Tax=Devosia rhizosphaerae TaxID=3049774 RepID=UPI0025421AC6|nr:ABC transporter permease subunit [Devosia sp. RR2S18]WIJ25816.1 ABC transporter permease subunit [Devosia sp. RR2S18]
MSTRDNHTAVASPTRSPSLLSRSLARLDPVGVLGLVLTIAIWHVIATLQGRVVPSPLAVANEIVSNFFVAPTFRYYGIADAGYLDAILYTTSNVLMATAAGGVIGIIFGLMTARRRLLRSAFDPIFSTLSTIPIFIAAPFLLLWFGVNRFSAVVIVALYVMTIVYVYAQRALYNLQPIYEQYARTLGANERRLFTDILVPGTLPEILGGLRIALAGAWGLAAISELIGSQRGAGKVIQSLANSVDVKGIFCVLLLLGITATLIDWCLALGIGRLTSWANQAGSKDD